MKDCHSTNLYLHFLRFLLNGLSSPVVFMTLCLPPIKNGCKCSSYFIFFPCTLEIQCKIKILSLLKEVVNGCS